MTFIVREVQPKNSYSDANVVEFKIFRKTYINSKNVKH